MPFPQNLTQRLYLQSFGGKETGPETRQNLPPEVWITSAGTEILAPLRNRTIMRNP
jgi:hypothetical protein